MKEGWKYKKLNELCNITTGKHDANHAKEGGLYRFYTCASQYLFCDTFKFDGDCLILPGNGANVGDVYKYSGKFDAYQRTYVLCNIKSDIIAFDFLYYFFLFKWRTHGTAKQYGAATNYIVLSNFTDFNVYFPPLPEQRTIVARLDSVFAQIDALKANAEKQLSEARKLFQKALEEAMTPKEGWEEKKFKDLCTFVRGPFGGSLKKECFVPSGFAVYEQQNAIYNRFTFRYFINEEKYKSMIRFTVEPGDLIMSCSGTIGKVAIVPEGAAKGIINQALLKLSPKEILDKYYLKYLMESSFFDSLIAQYSDGAAIKNIASVAILKDIFIPFPPLLTQHTIVAHLDALSSHVRALEEVLQKTIAECDALKQSILRSVFEE